MCFVCWTISRPRKICLFCFLAKRLRTLTLIYERIQWKQGVSAIQHLWISLGSLKNKTRCSCMCGYFFAGTEQWLPAATNETTTCLVCTLCFVYRVYRTRLDVSPYFHPKLQQHHLLTGGIDFIISMLGKKTSFHITDAGNTGYGSTHKPRHVLQALPWLQLWEWNLRQPGQHSG